LFLAYRIFFSIFFQLESCGGRGWMAGRGIAGVLDAIRFLIYGMNYGLMSGRKETESNFLFNLGEVESWSFGGKW
jgi:hypothetical protein